jgi:hypothetical protein
MVELSKEVSRQSAKVEISPQDRLCQGVYPQHRPIRSSGHAIGIDPKLSWLSRRRELSQRPMLPQSKSPTPAILHENLDIMAMACTLHFSDSKIVLSSVRLFLATQAFHIP